MCAHCRPGSKTGGRYSTGVNALPLEGRFRADGKVCCPGFGGVLISIVVGHARKAKGGLQSSIRVGGSAGGTG
jgi:hypothetical protein